MEQGIEQDALTTSLGASSSTVQNDDNVRRGQKKQEIYSWDVFLWQDSEQEPILQLHC